MQQMFYKCEKFNQSLQTWNIVNANIDGMFDECGIEEKNKPGAIALDPAQVQTELTQLYEELHGPTTKDEIAEQCHGNNGKCPVTWLSLEQLRKLKRLVKLDGYCYAFYAFSEDIPLKKDPFAQKDWSNDSKEKIARIRTYMKPLQEEFKILEQEEDQEDEPTGGGKKSKKSKNIRRTKSKSKSKKQKKPKKQKKTQKKTTHH
jgi:hypothetical protein